MFETKIKNNVTYIDGVPSDKWTSQDWAKWRANTTELMQQCDRIFEKLMAIGAKWGQR